MKRSIILALTGLSSTSNTQGFVTLQTHIDRLRAVLNNLKRIELY